MLTFTFNSTKRCRFGVAVVVFRNFKPGNWHKTEPYVVVSFKCQTQIESTQSLSPTSSSPLGSMDDWTNILNAYSTLKLYFGLYGTHAMCLPFPQTYPPLGIYVIVDINTNTHTCNCPYIIRHLRRRLKTGAYLELVDNWTGLVIRCWNCEIPLIRLDGMGVEPIPSDNVVHLGLKFVLKSVVDVQEIGRIQYELENKSKT